MWHSADVFELNKPEIAIQFVEKVWQGIQRQVSNIPRGMDAQHQSDFIKSEGVFLGKS